MWIQATSSFCSDDDFFFAVALQLGQKPLTAAVAVNVSRVEEIHAQINRAIESGD